MNDPYWGLCPDCANPSDHLVDIGPEHWAVCHRDRYRWRVGTNLFSAWRDRSLEEELEVALPILGYVEVEPLPGPSPAA